MVFKTVCPNCQSKNKVVRKCLKCGKYSCINCTVGQLCIDCYITSKSSQEIEDYNKIKYSKENEVIADLLLDSI